MYMYCLHVLPFSFLCYRYCCSSGGNNKEKVNFVYRAINITSQGWASGVLLFRVYCVSDSNVCICLFVWVGLSELSFSSFCIFSLLVCYAHVSM